jgi:hypothetical protein
MSYFANAKATVTRPEGTRGPSGFEQTGSTTILEARGGAQLSGRSLERLQQLHEVGDLIFFAEEDVRDVEGVGDVQPGDAITVDRHDGAQYEGSVAKVRDIDDSLLISL